MLSSYTFANVPSGKKSKWSNLQIVTSLYFQPQNHYVIYCNAILVKIRIWSYRHNLKAKECFLVPLTWQPFRGNYSTVSRGWSWEIKAHQRSLMVQGWAAAPAVKYRQKQIPETQLLSSKGSFVQQNVGGGPSWFWHWPFLVGHLPSLPAARLD